MEKKDKKPAVKRWVVDYTSGEFIPVGDVDVPKEKFLTDKEIADQSSKKPRAAKD